MLPAPSTHTLLLPASFPTWLEGLKAPFSPRMPAFPLHPLSGQGQAHPISLRNPRWLLWQPAASSQTRSTKAQRGVPAPCSVGTAVPKRRRESLRGSKEKILTREGSSGAIIKRFYKREKPLSGLAARTLLGFWAPFLQLSCPARQSVLIPPREGKLSSQISDGSPLGESPRSMGLGFTHPKHPEDTHTHSWHFTLGQTSSPKPPLQLWSSVGACKTTTATLQPPSSEGTHWSQPAQGVQGHIPLHKQPGQCWAWSICCMRTTSCAKNFVVWG